MARYSSAMEFMVFGALACMFVLTMLLACSDPTGGKTMRGAVLPASDTAPYTRGNHSVTAALRHHQQGLSHRSIAGRCSSQQAQDRAMSLMQRFMQTNRHESSRFAYLADLLPGTTTRWCTKSWHTLPTEQDIDLWSSSCSLRTITDLASVLAPSNDVLSTCAVADALSTAGPVDPLQQHMFEACERQRTMYTHRTAHALQWIMRWWHALQTAFHQSPPAPALVPAHATRVTCPNTHDGNVGRIWAAYDAEHALQGDQGDLYWDVRGNDTTALGFLRTRVPSAASVVVYDAPASLPNTEQLCALLESHLALVVVRTAEANSAAPSVEEWVHTMQSYQYTCLLRVGGSSMQATGCLSAALAEAAKAGDVLCVSRARDDLILHWNP